MKHTFEYFYQTQAMDSFLVEDISNVTLNFLNDIGQEWYVDVSTDMGSTTIRTFGPILVDFDTVTVKPFNFFCSLINYNEGKIISSINKILSNESNGITQVSEIDRETFNDRLRGIIDESCKENSC